MQVRITAQSLEELKPKIAKIFEFTESFGVTGDFSFELAVYPRYLNGNTAIGQAIHTPAHTTVEVETPKVEEKKASKPKKEKVEALKEEPKQEETAAPSFTKQDIANACQKVSEKKNLDAAKAILAQFQNASGEPCRRISDVSEADYAEFIAKCEAILA